MNTPLTLQAAWAVIHFAVHSLHMGLSPLFTPETAEAAFVLWVLFRPVRTIRLVRRVLQGAR